MTDVPQVLFVCVHNAGRSQMAAVLLDHEAHGQVRVMENRRTPARDKLPTDPAEATGIGGRAA